LEFSLIVLKLILLANHYVLFAPRILPRNRFSNHLFVILMGIYRNNSTVFGTLSLGTNDGSDEM
jgi:hypothetical protein